MNDIRKLDGWTLEGRYWIRDSDGLRLPVIQGGTSANTVQTDNWAFGDDDGTQTGHTQDTESTDRSAQVINVNVIIRLQAQETAGKNDPWAFQLFADKNNSGTFTEVTTTRNDGLKKSTNGSSRTDGEAITSSRLSAPPSGTPTWVDGEFDDASSAEGTGTIALNDQYTEIEFCITLDSNASNGDFWDLRLESTSGTDLNGYGTPDYPRITASVLSPINITPPAVTGGADSVGPATVRLGSINITPTARTAGADSVNPTVRLGSVSITPTASSAGADSIDPTVTISTPPITPTPVSAGADSLFGEVRQGSVSVTPSVSSAGADSFHGETRQGSLSLSPTLVSAGADSIGPTVQVGSVSVTPVARVAGADSLGPTVRLGSISLTPAVAAAGADSVDPTVQAGGGDVNVTPAAVLSGCDAVLGAYQTLGNYHPSTDNLRNGWTDEGDGITNIYLSIDEALPSDSDYIKSSESPSTEIYRTKLDPGTDPGGNDYQYIEYRYKKDVLNPQINLIVRLKQGTTTVIASWSHTDIGTSYVQQRQALTTVQAGNITDYTDLYLEFEATEV